MEYTVIHPTLQPYLTRVIGWEKLDPIKPLTVNYQKVKSYLRKLYRENEHPDMELGLILEASSSDVYKGFDDERLERFFIYFSEEILGTKLKPHG